MESFSVNIQQTAKKSVLFKKNIKIMAGVKRTVYFMELFKKCHIILLASKSLLSLLLYIVHNMKKVD
jgi:hypothetical protein